jgi:hypothetical protein
MKTAILVDGGFYRRRAQSAFGDQTAQQRAIELSKYCRRHLKMHGEHSDLYRIFYYDCAPSNKRNSTHLNSNRLILAKRSFMPGLLNF